MQKTKFSAVVATFIVCFVFWVLLDFSFKMEEIIAGAIVSLLVALFSARFFIREDAGWFFNPGRFFALIGFWCFTFVGEMIKANQSFSNLSNSYKACISARAVITYRKSIKQSYFC